MHIISYLDAGHFLPKAFKEIGLTQTLEKLIDFSYETIPGLGSMHKHLNSSDLEPFIFPTEEFASSNITSKYEEILKKYHKSPFFLNRLAVKYLQSGEREKSIHLLKLSYKYAPTNSNTNTHLSAFYERSKDYRRALIHALASNPSLQDKNINNRIASLIEKLSQSL